MKRKLTTLLLAVPGMLTTAALSTARAEQLIPAGSLIQCTVSEPKLSSKTMDIGDPVLCRVSHVELYGRSTMPYGSYLVGRFEDYKDPGHFVGKGWMELKFDHLVVQPDTIIPIQAKVVEVPKYPVDKQGRIHGTGHPVRDTVEWLIPVLWPIDVLNLPRRGPRPTLKAETRLTLRMMDDVGVPTREEQARESGLIARIQTQAAAPMQQAYAAPLQQAYAPQPVYQQYAPPPATTVVVQAPAPVIVQAQAPIFYNNYPPPPPAPVAVVPYGYAYGPYGPAVYRPRIYSPY